MNTTPVSIDASRADFAGCVERSETHRPALMPMVRFAKALNAPYENLCDRGGMPSALRGHGIRESRMAETLLHPGHPSARRSENFSFMQPMMQSMMQPMEPRRATYGETAVFSHRLHEIGAKTHSQIWESTRTDEELMKIASSGVLGVKFLDVPG